MENMAFGAETAEHAVSLWLREAQVNHYDYATHTCDGSIMNCGHYLQLVGRITTRLGCGVKTGCGGSSTVWVCNYAPPYDWLSSRPY